MHRGSDCKNSGHFSQIPQINWSKTDRVTVCFPWFSFRRRLRLLKLGDFGVLILGAYGALTEWHRHFLVHIEYGLYSWCWIMSLLYRCIVYVVLSCTTVVAGRVLHTLPLKRVGLSVADTRSAVKRKIYDNACTRSTTPSACTETGSYSVLTCKGTRPYFCADRMM